MTKKIKKIDLVNSVFEKNNVDRKIISNITDALLEEIKLNLENGSSIELRGFGTFELRLRKGRKEARNPKTGEKVSVPEHYVAFFKPGKELKENLLKLNKN